MIEVREYCRRCNRWTPRGPGATVCQGCQAVLR
jgi:hypothetical protein